MIMKPDKQTLLNKYIALWNERLPQIMSDYDKDKIEFSNDENIGFKWTHLMEQEMLMWISLCCGDTVEYDQVPLDDFEFIINRRGFRPRMVDTLKNILIEIGIGNELKGENDINTTRKE